MSQSTRRETAQKIVAGHQPVTRVTRQRTTILSELRAITCHPTADEIYSIVRKKLPHISLGTVYRNLEILAESNEVLKLEYAGFQKRFDGNISEHQHIRCIRCGRVADVKPEIETPPVPDTLYVQNFTVLFARIEFLGLCMECQKLASYQIA